MRAAVVAIFILLGACAPAVAPLPTGITPAASPAGTTPTPVATVTAAASTVRCVEDRGEIHYASGGTNVTGTLMRPSGSGPFPAALVLHTSGGHNAHVLAQASFLTSRGMITFAPDYFAPTGVTAASYERLTFIALYGDTVQSVLADAIACLRERTDVDRDRIGVVGFSLGGYFAVVLAAQDEVSAVVAWYAAYTAAPVNEVPARRTWTEVAAAAKRPLLLLHGDADQRIRIDEARRAQAELERLGKRSELVVYPGVGHGYDQLGAARNVYDGAATADSWTRTLAFLGTGR